MSGDDDAIGAGTGDRGDQIHHVHFAERRVIVPCLLGDGHAGCRKLALDVLACLLDSWRACRPGADRDQLA
jgi:hypothetical protein